VNPTNPHLSDGELLRLVDGEGSAADRARWEAHLDSCPSCGLEYRQLSGLLTAVSAEVSAIVPCLVETGVSRDLSPTGRREHRGSAGPPPRRALLRAAAALLLLVVPLLSVAPLRAWVAERVREVLTTPEPPGDPTAGVPSPTAPGGELRFAPAGPGFLVEIASHQREGALLLHLGDGDAAGTLRFVDGAGEEGTLISERGMRIENSDASTGSYSLHLPSRVEQVSVRVAGQDLGVFRVGGPGSTATVDLRRGAPVRPPR
jgi:hypothetical protein